MSQLTKNYIFLPKKLSLISQNMGLGSGIRDFGIREKLIPDLGSICQKGTRSRIRNTVMKQILTPLMDAKKVTWYRYR